ncbi:MAG TPA: hypothetical protein VL463_22950 [Kofleriaceae bacterium]|nr:hypothetical protein [Kofleriaceae bacterium]
MFAVPRRLPHRTMNTIVLFAVMIGLVTGDALRNDQSSDARDDMRCLCSSLDRGKLRVMRHGHDYIMVRCMASPLLC